MVAHACHLNIQKAHRRTGTQDSIFKVILGYVVRLCLKQIIIERKEKRKREEKDGVTLLYFVLFGF